MKEISILYRSLKTNSLSKSSCKEGTSLETLQEKLGELPVTGEPREKVTGENSALIIVDMLKGFCNTGPLQSPHNDKLKHPIANLVAQSKGPILSVQDAHSEEDDEFEAFPPHCVANTQEAQLVEPINKEVKDHPKAEILEKQTLSPFFGAHGFEDWLKKQLEDGIENFYVVGNCTDLCVHQTAMGIRMWLSEQKKKADVKVILEMISTYDMPKENTPEGALPHPKDVFHDVFLHHMALNNVKIVEIVN